MTIRERRPTLIKTLRTADYGVDIDVTAWCGGNDATYVYKIARINGLKVSTTIKDGKMIATKHHE